jgi:hypothetical protein
MAANIAEFRGIRQRRPAVGAGSAQQPAALLAENSLLAINSLAIWAVQGLFASRITISPSQDLGKELLHCAT